MKGYFNNIEEVTETNEDFRRVLYTGKLSQLVVMCIPEDEEIGEEVHDVDQFIRIEEGSGVVEIDGVRHVIKDDDAVIIPAGTRHNVINNGGEALKLYTIYAPPEHKDKTVHKTKTDAEANEEHFDGQTTE